MSSVQNYALVWFMFLSRSIESGDIKIDANNPKVLLMSPSASGMFLCGRDSDGEPFLGIPSTLMPFFTEIDWVEASICREMGYLFLEARDPRTQMLHMSLGIKMREARLDVFCIKGKENIDGMKMNMKVFEQSKTDPRDVLFADQHELMNIMLKEVSNTTEIGSDVDAEYARSILDKSGVSSSYTSVKVNY